MRCDLCNVPCDPHKTPAWCYRTVNTVTGPNDPSLPPGMGVWAEDEDWLVCVDCHILIEEENRIGLTVRSIAVQEEQMKALGTPMDTVHRDTIVRIHKLFWTAKSINPPVPEPGHRA